jgi:sulfur-carrier protein
VLLLFLIHFLLIKNSTAVTRITLDIVLTNRSLILVMKPMPELMPETAQFPITVKLFAAYQDVLGGEIQRLVVTGTTVGQLLNSLIQENPQLEPWRNLTRFGVNLDFVEADTVLRSGDELVLIPPVSGG